MKKKASILVVDDDPNVLSSLSDVLKDSGYIVVPVDTGSKAIEKAGKQKFSAVLVDIVLPDIDGIKVLHSIKKIAPDISVIIMTAHAELDSSIKAMEEGAYDYIIKPYKVEHIKKVVARAVEKQQLLKKNRMLMEELADSNKKLQMSLKELKRAQGHLLKAEKVSTIGQMLVSLHHEINNPLTAIMGAAQVLLRTPRLTEKRARDAARITVEHVKRISSLIDKGSKIIRPVVVEYLPGVKMLDLKKGIKRGK